MWRNPVFWLVAGLLSPVVTPAVMAVYLPRDTRVDLRLKETLSSAESHVNDRVEFEVNEDVKVGDYVAIPAGSLAWGVVVEAVPRSRMMRAGKLSVDIRGVCLATGDKAELRGSPSSKEGIAARGEDQGPSSNVLALPALPVLMFVYGKDVTIPEGRVVPAYVSRSIQLHIDQLAAAQANTTCDRAPEPAQSSQADTLSTVIVRSSPSDAELTVDGRFLGNLPSTIHLTPGDHVVSISAPGRKTWERTVRLTPRSEINITATLEARPAIVTTTPAPASVSPSPVAHLEEK